MMDTDLPSPSIPVGDITGELRPVLVSGGIVFPDEELALILQTATGAPTAPLPADFVLTQEEARLARELAKRRTAGEPLPYVTGSVEFGSIRLAVGPGVFIPRPGTSVVVERALMPQPGTVVDLCTGCGTIALAMAAERPDAVVYGTDISATALEWAEENRSATGLGVTFLIGDLFEPLPLDLRGTIDVVVANPPHVPLDEARLLPRDVIEHEPAEALFGGADGLLITGRIVREAVDWLKPGGWLVCEVGGSQREVVGRQLESLGYADITVHLDHDGRRRVIEAHRPFHLVDRRD